MRKWLKGKMVLSYSKFCKSKLRYYTDVCVKGLPIELIKNNGTGSVPWSSTENASSSVLDNLQSICYKYTTISPNNITILQAKKYNCIINHFKISSEIELDLFF